MPSKKCSTILSRAVPCGAGDHRGKVGREEPAGAEELSQTEHGEPTGQHQDRRERGFDRQTLQRLREHPAAGQAECGATGHFLEEQQDRAADAD